MEQNNSYNDVIISSVRIPLKEEGAIDWVEKFDAIALNMQKDSNYYMTFEKFTCLDKNKNYSLYVADNVCPTLEQRLSFVQRMLNRSNFANANKVKYVLYVKGSNNPFGVVVEDF